MKTLAFTIAGIAILATPVDAQIVRLPPSVGATPIEIPYIDPDAPQVLQMQPLEGGVLQQAPRAGIVPLPLPRIAGGVAPLPLPGQDVAAIDPRHMPGHFSVDPLPLPQPVRLERTGGFTYAVLPDGTVYGDTNFGYTRFWNVEAYGEFLRTH